jgi:hypothetical protein
MNIKNWKRQEGYFLLFNLGLVFGLILFWFSSFPVRAEVSYGGVTQIGGTSYENAFMVATDNSGNVYVTGVFQGTVDFDPGTGTDNRTSNAGSMDIYLTKYDVSGSYQWTKVVGGASSDYGISVATDSSGNVYLTGYFTGTVDFDPGTGTDNRTSLGVDDIYLTKYDASGNYQWTKAIGGTGYDYSYSVVADSSGNVYFTGSFENTVDFDPGTGTDNRTSLGGDDIYLTKYDASGTYQWTKIMAGTGYEYGKSLRIDSAGNVYLVGQFENTVDFDSETGTDNRSSVGGFDVYLTKYDVSGSYQWTKTIGGTGYDFGNSVAVDGSGNVYFTGDFENSVDFDPETGADNRSSAGGVDIYLTKYDASGSYQWTKTVGGTGYDYGKSVAVDGSGNVYAVGLFAGTVDFDPGTGTDNYTSTRFADIYLTKYDISGTYQWTKTVGGIYSDNVSAVTADSSGNVYLTGNFDGTIDFDPSAEVDNFTSTVGNVDIYILKFLAINEGGGTYLNLDIGAIIALDCDAEVTMGSITGFGKSDLTTNSATCNVRTNNTGGYKLDWQASSESMSNVDADLIGAYTPVVSSTPEVWDIEFNESAWGARLSSASTYYNATQWGVDDTSGTAYGTTAKWLNVAADTPYNFIQKTSETTAAGDNEVIEFGAEIGSSKIQPSGTYGVTVTITATTL